MNEHLIGGEPKAHDDLEGELVEQTPGEAPIGDREVAVFNPLDAEPLSFKRALVSRAENYDALAMHLRGMLVPGKDFGRIHVANKNKCPKPWECSYESKRGHWSNYMLFAAGADKVLGMLGLASSYPGEQDFIRAALTGKQIADVIMKCNLVGHEGQVISEGMGACSRDEVSGSLNNAIKRACKRARVDAVLRLPSISALFEDDFLAEVDRAAAKDNSTSSRSRQVNSKYNTGATLRTWPLTGKLDGQRFEDMTDGAIGWILDNFQDKPDIHNAALRVREKRDQGNNSPPDSTEAPKPAARHQDETDDWKSLEDRDEWLRQYDDYPEAK